MKQTTTRLSRYEALHKLWFRVIEKGNEKPQLQRYSEGFELCACELWGPHVCPLCSPVPRDRQ